MGYTAYQKLINAINFDALPIQDDAAYIESIINMLNDARIVLIGEATHGTHEFYQMRAAITQRLIEQHGFMAVAIEGDWPDVYQINHYLQGELNEAQDALTVFEQFPAWLWRNTVFYDFIKWLRQYNETNNNNITVYGLDLYSLHHSLNAVINYLAAVDPEAAKRAQTRYDNLDHNSSPHTYGYLINKGIKHQCRHELCEQLLELQHHAAEYRQANIPAAEEQYFYTLQNARLVKNAEAYYRTLFDNRESAWNLRDQHMADTLNMVAAHLETQRQEPAKIVVWAHNSHIGDARATEMAEYGKINLGQRIREQYGSAAFLLGFSTYTGSVTAATEWGAPARFKHVQPGIPSSYEMLFHDAAYPNFLLPLKHGGAAEQMLHVSRLQRALGVIYLPEAEHTHHYLYTRLPYQFDAIIHLDTTTALKPLAYLANGQNHQELETYPTGI